MSEFHDYAQFLHDLPEGLSTDERNRRFFDWAKENKNHYFATSNFARNVVFDMNHKDQQKIKQFAE